MTENQDVPKTEEMNNLKNEIRQRNAVLIDQQTKRQIRIGSKAIHIRSC